MDDHNDLPPPPPPSNRGAPSGGPAYSSRPVWLRGAAIGMIALLAGSVILGMFLY